MNATNDNEDKLDTHLDDLFTSKRIQPSSDFTDRTLEKIRSDSEAKYKDKTLIQFPNFIAAAAAIIIACAIVYSIANKDSVPMPPTETVAKETKTTISDDTLIVVSNEVLNTDDNIYLNSEYLEYEELLLMSEALSPIASVDDYSNLASILQY